MCRHYAHVFEIGIARLFAKHFRKPLANAFSRLSSNTTICFIFSRVDHTSCALAKRPSFCVTDNIRRHTHAPWFPVHADLMDGNLKRSVFFSRIAILYRLGIPRICMFDAGNNICLYTYGDSLCGFIINFHSTINPHTAKNVCFSEPSDHGALNHSNSKRNANAWSYRVY